ncbi:hypothetical protein [Demequina globuliformis]|uniref:hypothetical protein n=1 Tax=Demequina globuliformis TaxID=676202 RepID=UPI000780745F|nr:hypothetical protein [Demequina globuliformis]
MTHDMSFEERQTAAGLAVGIVAVTAYVAIIAARSLTDDVALSEVAWQGPLLACVGVGAAVYALIYVSMRLRQRGETLVDERDERIRSIGEEAGASLTGIAVLAALIMLALDVDTFWVANVLLVLSFAGAVLQSATVLGAYRGGAA